MEKCPSFAQGRWPPKPQDCVVGEYSLVLAHEGGSNAYGYWVLTLSDLLFLGIDGNQEKMQNFLARAIRLYEQEPGEPFDSSRLGQFVQRWVRWATSGVPESCLV